MSEQAKETKIEPCPCCQCGCSVTSVSEVDGSPLPTTVYIVRCDDFCGYCCRMYNNAAAAIAAHNEFATERDDLKKALGELVERCVLMRPGYINPVTWLRDLGRPFTAARKLLEQL